MLGRLDCTGRHLQTGRAPYTFSIADTCNAEALMRASGPTRASRTTVSTSSELAGRGKNLEIELQELGDPAAATGQVPAPDVTETAAEPSLGRWSVAAASKARNRLLKPCRRFQTPP